MTDRCERHDLTPIGFIGLGAMGAAIAARLAPHVPLLVTDLRAAAVAQLVAHGGQAASQAEIAQSCTIVFTSLPRTENVRAVILGDGGLAATMRAGSVVVDMTTGNPVHDREFELELARRDVDFADAPVSGGPQAAAEGTLAILVGASDQTMNRIRPALDLISSRVDHLGPVGSGHAVKLVNNLLSACNRLSTLEAVSIAVKSGVDLKACINAINKSSGRSYITESTYPRFLLGEEPVEQNFTVGLMAKDITLALDLAADAGLVTRMGSVARELLSAAVEALGENADINRLMTFPT